jgi:type VI secretion system protein ImpF
MAAPKNDRLAPPLMYAFRAAHAARDAKPEVDIRDRGERVIAPRRVTARAPISERELRNKRPRLVVQIEVRQEKLMISSG